MKNNVLYDEFPEEERQDNEETIGESLALQFYYGNWSASVKEMDELNVDAREFYEFLEASASDMDSSLSNDNYYGGHFDVLFFIDLAEHFAIRSK